MFDQLTVIIIATITFYVGGVGGYLAYHYDNKIPSYNEEDLKKDLKRTKDKFLKCNPDARLDIHASITNKNNKP